MKAASELNGATVGENVIRVDTVTKGNDDDDGSKGHDPKKAVFVGNLAFDVEENALHALFADCGDISHVRIVRDSDTGIGKGFG